MELTLPGFYFTREMICLEDGLIKLKRFPIQQCFVSIDCHVSFRSEIEFRKLPNFIGGNFFNRLFQPESK